MVVDLDYRRCVRIVVGEKLKDEIDGLIELVKDIFDMSHITKKMWAPDYIIKRCEEEKIPVKLKYVIIFDMDEKCINSLKDLLEEKFSKYDNDIFPLIRMTILSCDPRPFA